MAVSLNDKPNTVIVTGDDTAVVVSGVGIQGGQGEAGTVDVGTVTTGAAGSSASVTNVGNQYSAILDFVIPRGDTGATGPQGPQGQQGATGTAATITVGSVSSSAPGGSATVTNSGTSSAAVLDFVLPRGDTGPQGSTGATGTAATITVGSTSTGAAGSTAVVTNSGTSSAAVLDFTIPRGDTGATGAQGAKGDTGAGVAAGGSTGQVLAKKSGTDYDTEWVAQSGISPTIIDAKGDLIVGTAADTAARLAVGTNGYALTADSAETAGIRYVSPIYGGNMVVPPAAAWIGCFASVTASNRTPSSTAGAAHNRLAMHPFTVPYSCTIDTLEIHIQIQGDTGSVQRLGIWASDSVGRPGTLLASGTVAADSTGVKQLSVSVALTAGLYWFGHAWQGGVPTTQPAFVGLTDNRMATGYSANNTNSPVGWWWYRDNVTGAFSNSPTFTASASLASFGPARMLARIA